MHAAYIVLPALAALLLAYRFYSAFLAARVMMLDDRRITPAHTQRDGHNYHPTPRWVLFGHHFAAIAGPGPLLGPVLAAQFGFAPGLLWLVAGVCLAGAVHDMIALWASVRRRGASLAEIARMEIGPVAGFTAAVAILFIVVIALAGVGLSFVNALSESPWGVFTISMTIPIAFFMGMYMTKLRPGRITEATVVGVAGLLTAVVLGRTVAESSYAAMFTLTRTEVIISLAIYGFAASVLPVWLLLAPRDYLSAFMKVGTVILLVIGVTIANPVLHMPALTQYVGGGGPIVPGPLYPFAFITIACGAISGFHSLVGTGTTPKMIDKESDIRPIGYGAMLMEGLVGVMALIAASSMHPGDYFAINTPPAVFATLDQPVVNLPDVEAQVGETIAGRTGGAVSLAVGMAQIFSALPGMRGLIDYWYHFAIMFEALFILTVIDAGTRVGRFLVGEFLGRAYKPFARQNWMPGSFITTGIVVVAWAYFISTGNISTIWPMFGIANQLLAAVALAVGTTILINMGRARYAWVTL
ncbi:MAG TPA: carbon starvation protein A, partial [Vicinamibacterales bacterium]